MCGHMITTNTQHLGIEFLEPAVNAPERDCLLRSTAGEIEDVKRENHVLLPTVLTQRDITVIGRWERKIRGVFADFSCHVASFLLRIRHGMASIIHHNA